MGGNGRSGDFQVLLENVKSGWKLLLVELDVDDVTELKLNSLGGNALRDEISSIWNTSDCSIQGLRK